MAKRVNIGCGQTPTKGWVNFDNTPAIKLAHSPFKLFLLRFFKLLDDSQIKNIEWNKANKIQYADATKKIPLDNASVNCLYSSHMLEHLSRDGAKTFLKEAFRVLRKDGVLRISVPDLQLHVSRYVSDNDADKFMENTYVSPPPLTSLKQKFQLLLVGYRHHQWMYDGNSLSKLLLEVGFNDAFIQVAGKTRIEDYGELNLYERSDESVCVEAIK